MLLHKRSNIVRSRPEILLIIIEVHMRCTRHDRLLFFVAPPISLSNFSVCHNGPA